MIMLRALDAADVGDKQGAWLPPYVADFRAR